LHPHSIAVGIFRSDRRCLLLVLAPAILLFALNLGGRDLWAPDEPRAGVLARALLRGGSWAALEENGRPYTEKPPLYFWLAAIAALPAGEVTEFNVRLPASLAALAGVAAMFYLGRDLFGRRTGALAAIVLMTTQGYFLEARWAHPDMLWAVLLLVAALAFHRAHRAGGDARWLALFHLACGLAVLAKGPLGIVLPWLAVLVYLTGARDLAFLPRTGWTWGLPLAILPAGLWLLAYGVAAGNPFPLAEALLGLGRRFAEGVHHPKPVFHLLVALPVEFLPWSVFLPGAAAQTFPRPRGRSDRDNAYVWSWILVLAAVFGLSAEKRGVYLLPLLPFLAILVARVWDTALMGWEPSPVDGTIRWGLAAAGALAAAATALLVPRLRREAPDLLTPAVALGALALLTVSVALALLRRRGGGAALAGAAAGTAVCLAMVAVTALPALDRHKSAREFCHRVAAAAADGPLAVYPDYRSVYAFYTGRILATPTDQEELRAFLRSAPRTYALMEDIQYEVERRTLGIDLEVIDRDRVGHRVMLLVAVPAPPAPVPAAEEPPARTGPPPTRRAATSARPGGDEP
jgi:4-amino-4-deoxy-L-arabinose transferase-like glycosyltransferase